METYIRIISCYITYMISCDIIFSVYSIRLQPKPTYFITAPKLIRPAQTVQIVASVFDVQHTTLQVAAVITKDGTEYAQDKQLFTEPTTKILQLQMPESAGNGSYRLRVFGQLHGLGYGYVFYNETDLVFNPKYVSVFIQTEKPFYPRRDTLRFRVVAVDTDLMPVTSGTVTIYVKDIYGRVVRRFLSEQLYNGFYETEMELTHPKLYGWWTIEVHGWGHVYTEKFYIYKFYPEKFYINASLPAYILDKEYGLEGLITSNYTNGYPVHGNATVQLEFKNPLGNTKPMVKSFPQFKGVTSFVVPMTDIAKAVGGKDNLPGTKIKATITTYDWYSQESKYKPAVIQSEIYSSGIMVTFIGGKVRTFKPGFLFPILIAFSLKDGTRYNNRNFRIIKIHFKVEDMSGDIKQFDIEKVIPDSGIIQTEYLPKAEDKFVTVRATLSGYKTFTEELTAYRHQTHSGHMLYIRSSSMNPEANTYMVLTVTSSTHIPQLHYMVMSKGNLLFHNTLQMKSTQKTFSIALSRSMVPEAKVIVYGLLNTGEVLADSLAFHVKGIRNNGFSVSINRGKDFSRDTVEINGSGDRSAFAAFAAQQYELYNKGFHSFLTEHKVEMDLQSYVSPFNQSFKHTFYSTENKPETVYYNTPSYAIDPNTTFQLLGLTVFTDADLYRINWKDGYEICNHTLGYLSCYDNTCYRVEDQCDGVRHCKDGADELFCNQNVTISRPDYLNSIFFEDYVFDSAKWAWKSCYTKPYGRADFQVSVPFRPRTWLVSGFTLSHTEGLAFQEHPARMSSTRFFYLEIEHDSQSVWGEQLGIQVTVFNYWHQSIEAIIILSGSSKYKYIHVEDFGIVSSYSPRTTVGDVQTMVNLQPGEAKLLHFPILPVSTGKITITVTGESLVGRYKAEHSIKVKMDGITNTYHTPYMVDLVNKGSVLIPDMWIPVPERFMLPEQREHEYVPGSQKAIVSLVGDIFGPSFSSAHTTLYDVLKLIHGSGEQVAFSLRYNVLLLRYLKLTNQLPEKKRKEMLSKLAGVLQQATLYVKPDGSASLHTKSEPDVWTTAVILDTLCQLYDAEWEDILYIDLSMIGQMVKWLTSQQASSGAFITGTYVYDMKLRSNLTDTDGNLLHLSMTASVIIGLQAAVNILSGDVTSLAIASTQKAATYIATYLEDITDPFEMCIVTYALHITNHRSQADAFNLMRKMARIDEYVYWSPEKVAPNPIEVINARQYQHPRELPKTYSATAVHATALALRVYLRNNWLTEAFPIMAWLQTQRDADAGFIGSQDTLAAYESLLEFAERDTNRELYNMAVDIQSTASAGWGKTVYLKRQQLNTYTMLSVPLVYGAVRASAQGSGMALLQMTTSVNVEHPWQIRRPSTPVFDLYVDDLTFTGRNLSVMYIKVCAKWLLTEKSPTSGDVTIEIDVPTGFMVRKDILRNNQAYGRAVRSRFTKHKVVNYVEYLDSTITCWKFTAERRYPVANTTIQHEIKIYDTKEPGLQNRIMYTTYGLFHLHICQVCGSFQCPYCPYYNSANRHSTHPAVILTFCYIMYYWTVKL